MLEWLLGSYSLNKTAGRVKVIDAWEKARQKKDVTYVTYGDEYLVGVGLLLQDAMRSAHLTSQHIVV